MDHCYGEYVNGGSVDGAATRRMLVKNNDEQSRCAFVSPAPWRTLLKNGRAPAEATALLQRTAGDRFSFVRRTTTMKVFV